MLLLKLIFWSVWLSKLNDVQQNGKFVKIDVLIKNEI